MKFMFKGVDFFPHDTRWKIIERRYVFIGLSWALAMLAAVLLMTRGLNYGVDFKGGSLIEVQSKAGAIDIGDLRIKLDKLGIGDVQVQAVGLGSEALIRVAQQVPTKELNEEKVQAAANDKVKGALGESLAVRRIEVVGPTVSSELKRTGVVRSGSAKSNASSIGKSAVTRLARITQSHKGSNFFHPPAYATCLSRSLKPGFAQAPFQIEPHL